MMANRITLVLILLAILSCKTALAETPLQYKPNWNEFEALAAIGSVDTKTETTKLKQLARSGDSAALLEGAIAVHENNDWPAPARAFVLFDLARSLGDLPAGRIDKEVTSYLAALPADVRIAHPDHPEASIPMFNIAAAASGATVEWERQAAALEAKEMIRSGPQAWLDSYLQATPDQRDGFHRSAARFAEPELAGLAEAALDQAETHPELAVIATMAGLRLGDTGVFNSSLIWNDRHGLAEMIRLSREVFPQGDLQKILLNTVQQAPVSTASIVIAELAPALLDQPPVENLLIELLGDAQLGASAALVLSNSDSPRMHARLTTISHDDPGLAAKRAGLALAAMEARR